ncbi:16516_t:CDS:2, partial [Racocetra fulgida]
MDKCNNFLPSADHLSALAKGRIPENTVRNTEGWIKIMDEWRLDVNYNEPLENQSKEMIELQVSQFLCGVTTKKGKPYSRASLKNALSAINRHLQNIKPDGIMLKKNQQKNDQGGLDGSQFDLIIPFPSDPPGVTGPNADIKKYLSFRSKHFKCLNFYLSVCRSPNDKPMADRAIRSLFKTICIDCGLDIETRDICNYSGRRTSIMELFSIRVPENTGRAISGHKSSGSYYAYAKPTNQHKREALANVLNKLITHTPSNQETQELIEYTDPISDYNKDSQNCNDEGSANYDNEGSPTYMSESEEYLSEESIQ